MKYLLPLLITSTLIADQVKVESLACPELKTLNQALSIDSNDYLELNLFAIKHSCLILNRKTQVQVIDYDVNSRSRFIKIQDKKSLQELYVLRKNITIEQPGDNNTIKF